MVPKFKRHDKSTVHGYVKYLAYEADVTRKELAKGINLSLQQVHKLLICQPRSLKWYQVQNFLATIGATPEQEQEARRLYDAGTHLEPRCNADRPKLRTGARAHQRPLREAIARARESRGLVQGQSGPL